MIYLTNITSSKWISWDQTTTDKFIVSCVAFGISKLNLKVHIVKHLIFGKLKLRLPSFTAKTNSKILALTKSIYLLLYIFSFSKFKHVLIDFTHQ